MCGSKRKNFFWFLYNFILIKNIRLKMSTTAKNNVVECKIIGDKHELNFYLKHGRKLAKGRIAIGVPIFQIISKPFIFTIEALNLSSLLQQGTCRRNSCIRSSVNQKSTL